MKNTIYITYETFNLLKRINLAKGINQFNMDQIEDCVMFFDENHNWIDPQRLKIEDVRIYYVLLPRFIWLENLDKLEDFLLVDNDGNKITVIDYIKIEEESIKRYKENNSNYNENYYNSLVEPRENQVPIIEEINKNLKEKEYIRGILQAAPGTGKTFMSIYFAKKFKKTLIIVPKNVLVDQWIKAIVQFTNLTEENIGIIQGSDKKDIIEVMNNQDKKIILTKPQSLISQIKRIPFNDLQELYKDIQLVVFDECHNAGAEGFSKSLSIFRTPNILGLTATPYRRGINEFLLKNSIGEVIIEADAEVLTPDVYFRILSKNHIQFTEDEVRKIKMQMEYPMKLAFFNMFLQHKIEYMEHLADWLKWSYDQGRESVILFSTNKLGKQLEKFLTAKYQDLDGVLFLTGNSKNDAINIAKVKNREIREKLKDYKEELNQKVKDKELKRKEADGLYKEKRIEYKELQDLNTKRATDLYDEKIRESKIIISNFSLLREGFDKPMLSFVIFGSPVIGRIPVIQSLGRITRLADNKQTPIALFPIPETFLEINDKTFRILENNIKSTYPKANIKWV